MGDYLRKYDANGVEVWSHGATRGASPSYGRLLQATGDGVRVLLNGHMGYQGVLVLNAAGEDLEAMVAYTSLPSTRFVWPADDGSFVAASAMGAERHNIDSTKHWLVQMPLGNAPAPFANVTKVWIAGTVDAGPGHQVNVEILASANGTSISHYNVSIGKTY